MHCWAWWASHTLNTMQDESQGCIVQNNSLSINGLLVIHQSSGYFCKTGKFVLSIESCVGIYFHCFDLAPHTHAMGCFKFCVCPFRNRTCFKKNELRGFSVTVFISSHLCQLNPKITHI